MYVDSNYIRLSIYHDFHLFSSAVGQYGHSLLDFHAMWGRHIGPYSSWPVRSRPTMRASVCTTLVHEDALNTHSYQSTKKRRQKAAPGLYPSARVSRRLHAHDRVISVFSETPHTVTIRASQSPGASWAGQASGAPPDVERWAGSAQGTN